MTCSDVPEFATGMMPRQLNGVNVKIDRRAAYIYFISPTQINVLTLLDGSLGQVPIGRR